MKIRILFLPLLILLTACGAKDPINNGGGSNQNNNQAIVTPSDPETAPTVGFFLDNWKIRNFEKPASEALAVDIDKSVLKNINIDASQVITKVSTDMFGQNSVSFLEGLSDKPVMEYINDLKPTTIRFPGGSISDTYFWNRSFQDKPADAPDYLYDGEREEDYRYKYWYGMDNPEARANLSDYYSLLEQTGANGFIIVNYAYARYGLSADPVAQAAHLAAEWVRYDNGRTKYWEIGNENHGGWERGYRINTANNKDGQPEYITGALYAKHAKVFIDSMRNAARQINKTIYIGVGMVEEPNSWLYTSSKAAGAWNQSVLTEMRSGNTADFYSIHSYFLNNTETTYELILQSAVKKTGEMVRFTTSDMTKFNSPTRPLSLSEYNIYSTGSAGRKQQVSFVNGMHTTLVLGESLINKIGNTIRWDFVNGWDNGADHGMFNIGDEPGGVAKWNPRPVFYYMYYFQKMLGDRIVPSSSEDKNIHTYASSFSSGQKGIIIVNKDRAIKNVEVTLKNHNALGKYYWYELTGGSDNGDFSGKVFVNKVGPSLDPTGGPKSEYKNIKAYEADAKNGIYMKLAPRSVNFVVIE